VWIAGKNGEHGAKHLRTHLAFAVDGGVVASEWDNVNKNHVDTLIFIYRNLCQNDTNMR